MIGFGFQREDQKINLKKRPADMMMFMITMMSPPRPSTFFFYSQHHWLQTTSHPSERPWPRKTASRRRYLPDTRANRLDRWPLSENCRRFVLTSHMELLNTNMHLHPAHIYCFVFFTRCYVKVIRVVRQKGQQDGNDLKLSLRKVQRTGVSIRAK